MLAVELVRVYFFFFQAEDGIRDGHVTGVQTCALPILPHARVVLRPLEASGRGAIPDLILATEEVERLRRQIEQLLADATGRPREQVRRDLERERVLDAQAAVAYGLRSEEHTSELQSRGH